MVVDASHWDIPDDWRAPAGAVTPDGRPAQFRSAAHAVMAVRIHFLSTHPAAINAEPVDEVMTRYRSAWDQFTANCRNIVAVANHVDNNNPGAASEVWNSIDQPAVDKAFAIVMGEREPHPVASGRSRNLSTLARAAFLPGSPTETAGPVRNLADRDRNEAWDRSGGLCVSCGTPTTRTSQHQRLRRLLPANRDLFDLEPTYINTKGNEVPLWSERILIAAKGTPDHVTAASRSGPTTTENLANTCAACQFARGNWTLDDLSVPVYGTH